MAASFEHRNDLSGSTKDPGFFSNRVNIIFCEGNFFRTVTYVISSILLLFPVLFFETVKCMLLMVNAFNTHAARSSSHLKFFLVSDSVSCMDGILVQGLRVALKLTRPVLRNRKTYNSGDEHF